MHFTSLFLLGLVSVVFGSPLAKYLPIERDETPQKTDTSARFTPTFQTGAAKTSAGDLANPTDWDNSLETLMEKLHICATLDPITASVEDIKLCDSLLKTLPEGAGPILPARDTPESIDPSELSALCDKLASLPKTPVTSFLQSICPYLESLKNLPPKGSGTTQIISASSTASPAEVQSAISSALGLAGSIFPSGGLEKRELNTIASKDSKKRQAVSITGGLLGVSPAGTNNVPYSVDPGDADDQGFLQFGKDNGLPGEDDDDDDDDEHLPNPGSGYGSNSGNHGQGGGDGGDNYGWDGGDNYGPFDGWPFHTRTTTSLYTIQTSPPTSSKGDPGQHTSTTKLSSTGASDGQFTNDPATRASTSPSASSHTTTITLNTCYCDPQSTGSPVQSGSANSGEFTTQPGTSDPATKTGPTTAKTTAATSASSGASASSTGNSGGQGSTPTGYGAPSSTGNSGGVPTSKGSDPATSTGTSGGDGTNISKSGDPATSTGKSGGEETNTSKSGDPVSSTSGVGGVGSTNLPGGYGTPTSKGSDPATSTGNSNGDGTNTSKPGDPVSSTSRVGGVGTQTSTHGSSTPVGATSTPGSYGSYGY